MTFNKITKDKFGEKYNITVHELLFLFEYIVIFENISKNFQGPMISSTMYDVLKPWVDSDSRNEVKSWTYCPYLGNALSLAWRYDIPPGPGVWFSLSRLTIG